MSFSDFPRTLDSPRSPQQRRRRGDDGLDEHRDALTRTTQELSQLSRSNSAMLEVSYRAVQETLDHFDHTPQDSTTY